MAGIASILYGSIVYLVFFGTFLYAIAFVGNLPVPKVIDSPEISSLLPAIGVNVLLLAVFSLMSRGLLWLLIMILLLVASTMIMRPVAASWFDPDGQADPDA